MRFLHTGDLHLKKDEESRFEIFEWLVKKAGELGVDQFVIAGDLFDSDTDATLLGQRVRKVFESAKCTFLIVCGNHDAGSFGPDRVYGENVIQLTKEPFEIIEAGGFLICGVPYQDRRFSECVRDIPKNVDILIAHGTVYDRSYIFSMLDDQETRYMPIFPDDLRDIARYVAMGHIHARPSSLRYGKTEVVYPGSPVALDTKCEGERSFQLVEMGKEGICVRQHAVEKARYYVTKEFFVYPRAEKMILDAIGKYLAGIDDPRMMPRISVKGSITENEKAFMDELSSMHARHEPRLPGLRIDPEIKAWDVVLQNPMVQDFVARTEGLDDRLRMKIFEICLPVFDKVLK
jgi:DNA repair exonuclease SbcCD nuclease subunit